MILYQTFKYFEYQLPQNHSLGPRPEPKGDP